ncbi:response regulator [Qaidamihabitans albus]|uniref:response regulator n=1 Tax=Qaidamihabitans albus TaxID=2795733 RepID=UPI0018F227F8|nr:response regulator transcription factor [Qaidamihabitans albus]
MITAFVVDDHEVVRRGVVDLIEADPELAVVGEAATAARAIARIPALHPDVAVLDLRLPDGNGIELCRELQSKLPELNCLMLTSYTDEEAMLDAILAGANGYVVKDIEGLQLVSAIHDVGSGLSLLDNHAARALMTKLREEADADDPFASLTERERTLLELIGEGMTNRQIAEHLYLAEKTIKNYVSRVLTKLGVERRTQAAILASRLHTRRQAALTDLEFPALRWHAKPDDR